MIPTIAYSLVYQPGPALLLVAFIVIAGIIACAVAIVVAERRRAHEDLRLYQKIAENIQVGVTILQLANPQDLRSFRIVAMNPAAGHLARLPATEAIGKTLAEASPALLASELPVLCAEVIRSGKAIDLDSVRVGGLDRYGTERVPEGLLAIKAFPLPNHCVGLTFEDITERTRTETALRASEALYHSLVETMPVNIYRKDLEGRFTFANRAWCELKGKALGEVIGKTDYDFHPKELADKYRRDDLRVLETAAVLQHVEPYQKPSGERIDIQILKAPVRDFKGEIIGTQGIYWDVTERLRAEEALRAARARTQLILDTSFSAFIAIDDAGLIIDWNARAEAIFGWSRAEVIGQLLSETIIPPHYREAHRRGLHRFLETGDGPVLNKVIELTALRRDGKVLPVELAISPLRSGDSITFNAFLHDISERKRAEEELAALADELRRSNRELQEFASVASHDLQEPLRKIQAFGNRLRTASGNALSEQGREYLDRMQDAARRMQTLIDDLLSFARVTTRAQPFVSLDLSTVAREVVADLQARIEQTGGSVEVGGLPIIEADPTQMRQLFQNIIGNGLKFHRTAGIPVVKVHGRILADQEARASDNGLCGNRCEIVVEDNGIGFDEKYLDRIFAVFQRLHTRSEYEGTGMGLAICRKIVERHGGSITARSESGAGARFIITLPVKHEVAQGRQPTRHEEP